jgi:signal peptidase II
MKKSTIVILLLTGIIIIDQISKIYIKTHLGYGEGFRILGFDWARIYFVENEGMAYGMKIGGEYGKLILSLFRIVMVTFLGVLIYRYLKSGEKLSLLISFTLIMAGALGNIIDSAFYGLIFSETPEYHGEIASLVPFGEGYASFLHGKVVDMFYFPMIDTILPEWVPFWGGERFVFFQPVFNVADSSITVGVISLLLFNRKFFTSDKKKENDTQNSEVRSQE